VTVISVVGQIGALIGGTILGYTSTFFGRRLTMICGCFIGGALVPAYILPRNMTLVASAFFLQFFVGGVWGVIPIHLTELAPPALRTTAVGFTYQLGNLASSASATIQAVIGERYPLPPKGDVERFNYGKVIAIFMGAIWAGQIFFLFLGPEMSQEERAEYAASADDLEALRKQGVSLKEIGIQRAKADMPEPETPQQEKATDIEHVEKPKEQV
jgi:MFS transporter, SHS family, lactate transporter